jgi:hypothetical protein
MTGLMFNQKVLLVRASRAVHFPLCACVCMAILLFASAALATRSVTLAWDASRSTNVASYNIYYGSANNLYTNVVSVAGSTNVTISGLVEGATYYFAATAVNTAGQESPYSNQTDDVLPSSVSTLASLPNAAGCFSFNISGGAGYQYIVQTSTNLTTWTSVATNTAPFTFTDNNSPNLPKCFYRTLYLEPAF